MRPRCSSSAISGVVDLMILTDVTCPSTPMQSLLITSAAGSVTLALICGTSPDSLVSVVTGTIVGALGAPGTTGGGFGVSTATAGTPASGLGAGGASSVSGLGGGVGST